MHPIHPYSLTLFVFNNFGLVRLYVNLLIVMCFCGISLASGQELNQEKLNYAREVEKIALTNKDTAQLAEAYYLFGKSYILAGDNVTSQNYFLKAINLLEPLGNSFELGRLYLRISENESRRGAYPNALQYTRQAIRIFKWSKSDDGLLRAYDNMGKVYGLSNGKNKYDTMAFYYKESEKLAKKNKDTIAIASVNLQLGSLYVQYNKPDGITHIKKSLELFTAKKIERSKTHAMIELAHAYILAEQYELALQNLTEAKKLYKEHGQKEHDLQMSLTNTFTLYYGKTAQWKDAYNSLLQAFTVKESKLYVDRDSIVSRLNIEFESQKRETALLARDKELELKAHNIEVQRNYILAVSLLLALALGMSYILFRLNRKNERVSRQNVELVKEQNHRIKNNLQVVSSLLYLQARQLTDIDTKKAIEDSRLRIHSMSLIHQKLYNSDQVAEINLNEFVTELSEEVLNTYNCASTNVDLQVEDFTLSADKAIPLGLILTELLTNSCKHAFINHPSPELFIRCSLLGDIIQLTVIDNGLTLVGPGSDQSSKSFGMRLIRLQVEQLYGKYQFSHNSIISNEANFKNGTKFSMKFKAKASFV